MYENYLVVDNLSFDKKSNLNSKSKFYKLDITNSQLKSMLYKI